MTEMYHTDKNEKAPFGEHWVGPAVLKHSQDTLVAKYESEHGQPVEVYCAALPARFYRIEARAGKAGQPPFSLSTGSGAEKLAADIAEAISKDYLALTV